MSMTNCRVLLATNILDVKELPADADILFFEDHVGNDDFSKESWAWFNQLLYNNHSTLFIVEYLSSHDVINKDKTLCLPFQLYHTGLALNKILPNQPWAEKHTAFNFSINKLRYNRTWLLEELQRLGLTTSSYSVNCSTVNAFPNQFWLDKRCEQKNGYVNNNNLKNLEIYQRYLKQQVYDPSFISLITEPGWNDRSTLVTEKTLFAFESGTVPIWIGGYQQAQQLKTLGFDVFEDLINHDYQFITDPISRMQAAIADNLQVLTDIKQLQNFFELNQERFCRNRSHLRSNNWIWRHLDKEFARVSVTPAQSKQIYQRLIIEHNSQWPMLADA